MKLSANHLTILQIIHDLHSEGSGSDIRHAYENTGKTISIGQLYVWLDELESNNYIDYDIVKGGPERGYRDKRIYWLTGHGLAEVKNNERNLARND